MTWAERHFSDEQVDEAGDVLARRSGFILAADYSHALTVINNWRSSHAFPLNTFQNTLRNKARQIEPQPLVAQRVKRLPSIIDKLKRIKRLNLSEVQDIAGCRVVLQSVQNVDEVVDLYQGRASNLKHDLDTVNDYIRSPKKSGYRSVHLIYRYKSDKKTTYNGLKVEMQIRSTMQHAWATAVETVGTFTRQSLKSSQGEEDWLRFFALMGTSMSEREGGPPVPNTPTTGSELIAELREFAGKLKVEERLSAYGAALNEVESGVQQTAKYFLVVLDAEAKNVRVRGYKGGNLAQATADYAEAEQTLADKPLSDAVLVSVESIAALKRAYPNYFLDTGLFLEEVQKSISVKARGAKTRSQPAKLTDRPRST